jgi:hypothetical protein
MRIDNNEKGFLQDSCISQTRCRDKPIPYYFVRLKNATVKKMMSGDHACIATGGNLQPHWTPTIPRVPKRTLLGREHWNVQVAAWAGKFTPFPKSVKAESGRGAKSTDLQIHDQTWPCLSGGAVSTLPKAEATGEKPQTRGELMPKIIEKGRGSSGLMFIWIPCGDKEVAGFEIERA